MQPMIVIKPCGKGEYDTDKKKGSNSDRPSVRQAGTLLAIIDQNGETGDPQAMQCQQGPKAHLKI
jgi:hypothetical protein